VLILSGTVIKQTKRYFDRPESRRKKKS